ncbi:host attachment family protein [Pararhodobacter oceanensis]|uniref:host attachment family protein n=1 Tax=Pararhodobacter oceanensis TaxID=2172121 RepID=UPI003A936C51
MGKLDTGAWVLVADSEKALLLVNEGDRKAMHLQLMQKDEQDNPPSREQGANRPGRAQDGTGPHRSALDDTDWHQLAKERFAADLADLLYKPAHQGKFEKLVIVAAPAVLGILRSAVHVTVEEKIIAEVPKNLTDQPLDEIEKRVAEALEPLDL